jgi:hypothetical protein
MQRQSTRWGMFLGLGLAFVLSTGCATETDEGSDEPSTGESEEALCISPTGMAVPCPTGAACTSNFDCSSGTCRGGRCVAKDGERCSNDSGCASGFCHAGTCTACDNTQRFVPGRTDAVSRCTTAQGAEMCAGTQHFPCAATHTHGQYVRAVPQAGGCVVRREQAVRCQGALASTGRCTGSVRTCASGNTQTSGVYTESGGRLLMP